MEKLHTSKHAMLTQLLSFQVNLAVSGVQKLLRLYNFNNVSPRNTALTKHCLCRQGGRLVYSSEAESQTSSIVATGRASQASQALDKRKSVSHNDPVSSDPFPPTNRQRGNFTVMVKVVPLWQGKLDYIDYKSPGPPAWGLGKGFVSSHSKNQSLR